MQAQNDELQLNALKDAVLTSSAGKITIAAKEEVLITCKGAYIKLANGEVEIGSPKVVRGEGTVGGEWGFINGYDASVMAENFTEADDEDKSTSLPSFQQHIHWYALFRLCQ